MTDLPTPDAIAAIRARAETAAQRRWDAIAVAASAVDVPALLAAVEALTAERAAIVRDAEEMKREIAAAYQRMDVALARIARVEALPDEAPADITGEAYRRGWAAAVRQAKLRAALSSADREDET
jgi:hypothetical protein